MMTSDTDSETTAAAIQRNGGIKLYAAEHFAGLRRAGQLTAQCLDMLVPLVKPGITTNMLDARTFEFAMDHQALPATLNYRGYERSICTSINHVVCHGIPNDRVVREGDIMNIDVTLILDGWHGDASRMCTAGPVSRKAARLIEVTHECLQRAIAMVRPGARLGDIGAAIQELAEDEHFSVVQDFCGHGIGQLFHEPPNILHYGKRGEGLALRQGMVFTIEPMINAGKYTVKVLSDGWTAVTRDKSLSAQFEHMIGVTETGCEVFTASPAGLDFPPLVTA